MNDNIFVMTLLEYLNTRKKQEIVKESFATKDFNDAIRLINKYLTKHIDHLIMLSEIESFTIDGKTLYGIRWISIKSGACFRIGWETSDVSSNAYCVDFFENLLDLFIGYGKTKLSVYCNGVSVAIILPLIVEIMSTGKFDANTDLVKKLNETIIESFQFGNLKYQLVREDSAYAAELYRKKKSLQTKKSITKKMGLDVRELDEDIERINVALSSNSTPLMEEVLLSFKKNVSTKTHLNDKMSSCEKAFQNSKKELTDPMTTFKMMEKYLILAIQGDRNGVLICGAPGVGKTHRVTKFLSSLVNKKTGYTYVWAKDIDMINGDIHVLKGRASAAELYTYLWRTKDEGKILLIDDCDSVFTDENAINILKGALDGGKDRLVTWAVKGKLFDQDPLDPKNMIEIDKSLFYNGKIIILTNRHAGDIDTAIRSRVYIQDINFSIESILKLIEDIMPTMNSACMTEQGKLMALNYLKELAASGADMEISLRTFGTCADIFSVVCDSDEDIQLAREMVKENMRLQYSREGGKY